jgi:hypothetical protein
LVFHSFAVIPDKKYPRFDEVQHFRCQQPLNLNEQSISIDKEPFEQAVTYIGGLKPIGKWPGKP